MKKNMSNIKTKMQAKIIFLMFKRATNQARKPCNVCTELFRLEVVTLLRLVRIIGLASLDAFEDGLVLLCNFQKLSIALFAI